MINRKSRFSHITAIVPAAGMSSRMAFFKPLLPLGSRSVIQNTVLSLKKAGIHHIVVVTGFRSHELARHLRPYHVTLIKNQWFGFKDMYASIRLGVRSARSGTRAFLILPGDIPLIRPSTIRGLVQCFSRQDKPVLLPCFQGRGGHPLLVNARLGASLVEWRGDNGLRGWLDGLRDQIEYVPVMDRAMTLDLDTTRDYREMLKIVHRRHVPTPLECRVLMEAVLRLDPDIIRHSEVVAAQAARLGRVALEAKHRENIPDDLVRLDLDLLNAAALLHDICKAKPNHAEQGAECLRAHGFNRVADIVGSHMGNRLDTDRLNENTILFLADKQTHGDRLVDPGPRFVLKLKTYTHPKARENITRRYGQYQEIAAMFEALTGRSVQHILHGAADEIPNPLPVEARKDFHSRSTPPVHGPDRCVPGPGGNPAG